VPARLLTGPILRLESKEKKEEGRAMKWNREKAILEMLRFAYETRLDGLRKPGRIETWEKVKRHLFWDSPVTLGHLEDLDALQGTLRGFFQNYFVEILNIYYESPWMGSPGNAEIPNIYYDSPWMGSPGNEVDRLAKEMLSTGKVKSCQGAIKRVARSDPRLWEIYNIGEWRRWLPPKVSRKRSVYCNGQTLSFVEEPLPLNEQAVEQAIKLFALAPPVPISKFFRCTECGKWTINTRKTRKHWVCSKRCSDRRYVREDRDPQAHAKRARHLYWRKQGHLQEFIKTLEQRIVREQRSPSNSESVRPSF
jgi:hypothetical protein